MLSTIVRSGRLPTRSLLFQTRISSSTPTGPPSSTKALDSPSAPPSPPAVDPREFYSLTPEEQREVVRLRYEREIKEIQARREELDKVSHHVPGFSSMSLPERLKVEKGLKAPLDVKAYLELIGFDLRRDELYSAHPQIGPAAKATPYGRNFFLPYAWGVCLVSHIGHIPDFSLFAAGAVAAVAMRIAATAGIAAHQDYKHDEKPFDELKYFRIPKTNLLATAALSASVATAAMGLVVSPSYAALVIPACAGITWAFPQYAPITAAAGGILGTLTGPYFGQLAWSQILPLQAAVLIGSACSHYVFHMEGGRASLAALGVASLWSAALMSGMHKMFYPFFSFGAVQIVGTALQNFHVRSEYNGRKLRSGWYKDIPPGGQQAIFGLFIFGAMVLGRRYSHRVGLVIRERDTDGLSLDKREGALANPAATATAAV